MAILGQKVRAQDLGIKRGGFMVWAECSTCGHQRFVPNNKRCGRRNLLLANYKTTGYCSRCKYDNPAYKNRQFQTGDERYNWKGGKYKNRGYIMLRIYPNDFFYPMAIDNYVPEHRLVMAKHLGRNLHSWEIVHHRGVRFKGIKNRTDNLVDNLQLITDDRHNQITILERKIARRERKIAQLETENKRLKALIK